MIIRAIAFNPLRVEVNGIEVPVSKTDYLDENGDYKSVQYVMVDGEKFAVEYQEKMVEEFLVNKVDVALAKVEAARIIKIEDLKRAGEEKAEIKPQKI